MDLQQIAQANLETRLQQSTYPGRGVVLGLDETGSRLIQAYWIMGRSPNSRNRVFETDGTSVWTEAADPSQVKDPSLIIYNALREAPGVFIVTNGDQTDTIYQAVLHGGTFEQALCVRAYEPDAPNFTPRISGIFELGIGQPVGRLSVLKKSPFDATTLRMHWTYEGFGKGLGHCITTYMGDGSPLPAFEGEPYLVPLVGDPASIAETLWNALDADNRVSLCVKAIDPDDLVSEVVVVNQYEKVG